MATRFVIDLICGNMHVTEVELIDPAVSEDGFVTGLAGSDRDFCGVCETPEMTVLGYREMGVTGEA